MSFEKTRDVDNNIEFEDGDSGYSGGSKSTGIKDLALKQFSVCQKEASKEMTIGGKKDVFVDGKVRSIIAANQCQIYCNAVKALQITLLPEVLKDKTFNEKHMGPVKENLKKIEDWVEEKNKKLEEIRNSQSQRVRNGLNHETQRIREERDKKLVAHYDLVFEKMSLLINKLNYFNEMIGSAG